MGTDFHLEQSGPSLIKKARSFLETKDPPEEELESATKVLFLTKKIIRVFPFQKSTTKFDISAFCDEEKNLARRALALLAERRHVSELGVCLEMGKKYDVFLEEAYDLVKRGHSLDGVSPESLNSLATIAQKIRDPEVLLRIIARGGIPSTCSSEEQHEILGSALRLPNEDIIVTLLEHGFHFDFSLVEPLTPFIFACAEQGMTRAVQCMLTKGASHDQKDEEGNTLLHYAFLLGHRALAQTLLKVIDPTIKNDFGQTPLACLLSTRGDISIRLKKQNKDPLAFINDVLTRGSYGTDHVTVKSIAYRGFIKGFLGWTSLPSCGDMELGLLLADSEITDVLFRNISRKDFDEACEILAKKYPSQVIEKFILSAFSFTDRHYQTGCEILSLPKNYEWSTDPNQLIDLLENTKAFSQREKLALSGFLTRVKEGVYKGYGEDKKLDQETLGNLRHIAFVLSQKANATLTTQTLRSLITVSNRSSEEYFKVVSRLSREVEENPDPDQLLNMLDTVGGFSPQERISLQLYLSRSKDKTAFLQPFKGKQEKFYQEFETSLKHLTFMLTQPTCACLRAKMLHELITVSHKSSIEYLKVTERLEYEVDLYPDPYTLLTLLDEAKGFSRVERDALKTYLDNVKNRYVQVGTPRENMPALEDFYHAIETNLRHIVFSLTQKKNAHLTAETIREFVHASSYCGGKYYAVAQLQAQEVCLSIKSNPLGNLQRNIASSRNMCLKDIICHMYHGSNHNVHYYNTALRDLGVRLGIPGSSDPYVFNDIYSPQDFDAKKILDVFRSMYTPRYIIYDWILPQLKDDIDFRNNYIDLQKELVPESWIVPDNPSATREEKVQDFLGRFVYDEESKLRPSAVRFLLEKLGILRCSIQ